MPDKPSVGPNDGDPSLGPPRCAQHGATPLLSPATPTLGGGSYSGCFSSSGTNTMSSSLYCAAGAGAAPPAPAAAAASPSGMNLRRLESQTYLQAAMRAARGYATGAANACVPLQADTGRDYNWCAFAEVQRPAYAAACLPAVPCRSSTK